MRKTKIICTIGPASNTEKTIRELCLNGMNVARLNFSHGTHEDHKKVMDIIKKVRTELDVPVAIMLDTKGPEYRIKTFKDGKVTLKEGNSFIFTVDDIVGDETRVSVNYSGLINDVKKGDTILLNNGLMAFTVDEVKGNDIITTVKVGGETSNRKSMSFPNKVLNQEYLSEQDKSDILFGIENDVDYIACSFVSRKIDLEDLTAFMKENGGGRYASAAVLCAAPHVFLRRGGRLCPLQHRAAVSFRASAHTGVGIRFPRPQARHSCLPL